MMHHIYHDIYIAADQERIFNSIVLPEHLVNWSPLRCKGRPVVGSNYNFYFGDEYNWWGRVVKVEDQKCFHIKMTNADDDWYPTTFGFDIKSEAKVTWLQFWHKNLT